MRDCIVGLEVNVEFQLGQVHLWQVFLCSCSKCSHSMRLAGDKKKWLGAQNTQSPNNNAVILQQDREGDPTHLCCNKIKWLWIYQYQHYEDIISLLMPLEKEKLYVHHEGNILCPFRQDVINKLLVIANDGINLTYNAICFISSNKRVAYSFDYQVQFVRMISSFVHFWWSLSWHHSYPRTKSLSP